MPWMLHAKGWRISKQVKSVKKLSINYLPSRKPFWRNRYRKKKDIRKTYTGYLFENKISTFCQQRNHINFCQKTMFEEQMGMHVNSPQNRNHGHFSIMIKLHKMKTVLIKYNLLKINRATKKKKIKINRATKEIILRYYKSTKGIHKLNDTVQCWEKVKGHDQSKKKESTAQVDQKQVQNASLPTD